MGWWLMQMKILNVRILQINENVSISKNYFYKTNTNQFPSLIDIKQQISTFHISKEATKYTAIQNVQLVAFVPN